MGIGHWWNDIYCGKAKYSGGGGVGTFPSATLSTTNFTWAEPGSNSGLRGVSLATNRLSHGTKFNKTKLTYLIFKISLPTVQ